MPVFHAAVSRNQALGVPQTEQAATKKIKACSENLVGGTGIDAPLDSHRKECSANDATTSSDTEPTQRRYKGEETSIHRDAKRTRKQRELLP